MRQPEKSIRAYDVLHGCLTPTLRTLGFAYHERDEAAGGAAGDPHARW